MSPRDDQAAAERKAMRAARNRRHRERVEMHIRRLGFDCDEDIADDIGFIEPGLDLADIEGMTSIVRRALRLLADSKVVENLRPSHRTESERC